MTIVDGVFARGEKLGFDLLTLLESEPDRGNSELNRLVEETRAALRDTPMPFVYRLAGPEPAKATPMQYGGFFLERDRELLTEAGKRGPVWLFVDAGAEAYLDFVSDLPAEVFAWDSRRTGFPLEEMRQLRSGTLCTNEPGADLPLSALNGDKEVVAHAV